MGLSLGNLVVRLIRFIFSPKILYRFWIIIFLCKTLLMDEAVKIGAHKPRKKSRQILKAKHDKGHCTMHRAKPIGSCRLWHFGYSGQLCERSCKLCDYRKNPIKHRYDRTHILSIAAFFRVCAIFRPPHTYNQCVVFFFFCRLYRNDKQCVFWCVRAFLLFSMRTRMFIQNWLLPHQNSM